MVYMIFFLICFLASAVGAVCGIGGGVIIKPVLDAFGILDVETISFLSGCTVLSMTAYAVLKSRAGGNAKGDKKVRFPMAAGAALGGLAGKELFSFVASLSPDRNRVGAVQAFCLLLVTAGTLAYTLFKDRIHTRHVKAPAGCILIGISLGILSSFLGIGGGPVNLVVLFFFFSMSTKEAAESSLYIIFFSQTASLLSSLATGSIPEFPVKLLVLMVCGGILGGVCGRAANKRMEERIVDRLFIGLMVLMILINIYNIYKY
ncbi:MAG: sulfite exporter TauE/SafE family protein [Lachnospiraceae bacterium]|nr:sulfite exporter TauE/SafE family protein [Lachnospiraceae bacterium]